MNHNPELIPFGHRIGPKLSAELVERQAMDEINAENHAKAVVEAKARILAERAAGRWWHRFVPFTITIARR